MKPRLNHFLFGAIAAIGLSAPVQGADIATQADPSLWGVGRTGVMCYQLPCPWHGIFPISEQGERDFPISRHDQPDPPPMSGDPAAIQAVRAAYAEDRCVIVEGRLTGNGLDVGRIIGDC